MNVINFNGKENNDTARHLSPNITCVPSYRSQIHQVDLPSFHTVDESSNDGDGVTPLIIRGVPLPQNPFELEDSTPSNPQRKNYALVMVQPNPFNSSKGKLDTEESNKVWEDLMATSSVYSYRSRRRPLTKEIERQIPRPTELNFMSPRKKRIHEPLERGNVVFGKQSEAYGKIMDKKNRTQRFFAGRPAVPDAVKPDMRRASGPPDPSVRETTDASLQYSPAGASLRHSKVAPARFICSPKIQSQKEQSSYYSNPTFGSHGIKFANPRLQSCVTLSFSNPSPRPQPKKSSDIQQLGPGVCLL